MIAIDNLGGGGQSVDLSPIYRQLYDNSTNISVIQSNTQTLTAIPTIQNDTLVLSNMITNMTTQTGGGGAYWVGDTFGNIAYNMTGSVSDLSFITGKDLTYISNSLTISGERSISGIGNCLFQNNALSVPTSSSSHLSYTQSTLGSTRSTTIRVFHNFGVDGFNMLSNTISRGNCSFKGFEFMSNSMSSCLLNVDAYIYSKNTVSSCENVILNNYMNISNNYSSIGVANFDVMTYINNTVSDASNFQFNGKVASYNKFSSLKAFNVNAPFISYNSLDYETVGTFNCYSYSSNYQYHCDAVQVNAYSMKSCYFDADRRLTLNAAYFYNNTALNVEHLSVKVAYDATSNSITASVIGDRANIYVGKTFSSNVIKYPEGSVNISAHIISSNKFSASNTTLAANELRLNCRSCIDNSFSSLKYLYANHAPNNLTNTTLPFDIQSGLYIDHNDDIYDSDLKLNTNITFPESRLFVRGINLIPYIRDLKTQTGQPTQETNINVFDGAVKIKPNLNFLPECIQKSFIYSPINSVHNTTISPSNAIRYTFLECVDDAYELDKYSCTLNGVIELNMDSIISKAVLYDSFNSKITHEGAQRFCSYLGDLIFETARLTNTNSEMYDTVNIYNMDNLVRLRPYTTQLYNKYLAWTYSLSFTTSNGNI